MRSELSGSGMSKGLHDAVDQMCSRRVIIFSVALAALIAIVCCLGTSWPSFAREMRTVDEFDWQKEKTTGNVTASSRSDSSINFLDVGDLSYYSMYLVEETLGSIANAAGKKVDRSLNNAAIVIVHDINV